MSSINFIDDNGDAKPTGQGGSNGSVAKAALLVVALVVVAGAAWYMGGSDLIKGSAGNGQVLGVTSNYQAVFLTNGQVYFGKLATQGDWVVLRDIYYLQVTRQLQPAPEGTEGASTNPSQNIQLVKLGSELHGPQDEMYLDRDKLLFWENMKDDSKVVQAIKQYQETKK